jgi:hypothetical protein
MIDVEHSHPFSIRLDCASRLLNIRACRAVMGEGDEPSIESQSIFVANTKRIGYHAGGCKHESNQALPMEHRDNLTSETRSLDF